MVGFMSRYVSIQFKVKGQGIPVSNSRSKLKIIGQGDCVSQIQYVCVYFAVQILYEMSRVKVDLPHISEYLFLSSVCPLWAIYRMLSIDISRNVLLSALDSTVNVAFSAYLDHDENNLGAKETLVFNQILLNEGNSYNKYTGSFTAPTAGVYSFTFFIGKTEGI